MKAYNTHLINTCIEQWAIYTCQDVHVQGRWADANIEDFVAKSQSK